MCQESSISHAELGELCEEILETQRREIALMQSVMQRMEAEG